MPRFWLFFSAFFATLLVASCSSVNHQHSTAPAYRPDSENAAGFIQSFRHSRILVQPTIIRSMQQTSHSVSSQQQIVSLLKQQGVVSASAAPDPVNPGPLQPPPQWAIFVHDLQHIADQLKTGSSPTDYHLVLEIVFPPNSPSVWGIHCFILDRQGNNAFSFLLNSHHELFKTGGLAGSDNSNATRDRLVRNATQVAMTALARQLNAPVDKQAGDDPGYSVTSQKTDGAKYPSERIFVIARIHQRLQNVFMHSFKHSLKDGFESNGIKSMVKVMRRDSTDYAQFDQARREQAPDTLLLIDLDPLYRERSDGYQAVVGTRFTANAKYQPDDQPLWQADGKVDYIKMFDRGYTAHEGIRKEFAWHTSAAIVRTFMLDIVGRSSAPIYTVTEHRQANGQRTD